MKSGLFLPLALFMHCQNLPTATSLTESIVLSDTQGQIVSRKKALILHTSNSLETRYFDSRGAPDDVWYVETQGNTLINYQNDSLYSRLAFDPNTGCGVERFFAKDSIAEVTRCDDRLHHAVELGKQGVTETQCFQEGNKDTCKTTRNGESESVEWTMTAADATITVYDSQNYESQQTYQMEIKRPLPDGQKIEYYYMRMPHGSRAPSTSDPRWELGSSEMMTGFLPNFGLYASVEKYNVDDQTIETRTIRLD